MDPEILRAAERILVVLFGGLSIYLGYRLFLNLPDKTDSKGQVVLPGGVNIMLSRIGPGAFFALFGSIVVALSFYFPVKISSPANNPQTDLTRPDYVAAYYGFKSEATAVDPGALDRNRSQVRGDIFILNRLPDLLQTDLPAGEKVNIRLATIRAKLALMRSVWAEDWGDYVEFEEWVLRQGAADPVPEGLADAAKFFRHGKLQR